MARSSSLDSFAALSPILLSFSYTNHSLDSATKTDGTYSDDQWLYGFTPLDNDTLDQVHVEVSGVGGSPTASNITCDIFAADNSTNLSPTGASLGQATLSAASTGWRYFSGLAVSVTAGQKYFAVVRNKETTPASNYVQLVTPDIGVAQLGGNTAYRQHFGTSTNGGSTWSNRTTSGGAFVVYASGNAMGSPFGYNATDQQLYDTRLAGNKYTVPGSGDVPIVGFVAWLKNETGNPTGNVVGKLFNDSTLVTTSMELHDAIVSSAAAAHVFVFDDAYMVSGGSTIRLVVGVTSGGDSSNRQNLRFQTTPETTDSRACVWGSPLGCYYNGSSWTDTGLGLSPITPLVDLAQLTGGGGGLLTHPGMAGGLRG